MGPRQPQAHRTRGNGPQRAVITITDLEDGKFGAELSFRHAVRADDPMTPAIAAAMQCLDLLLNGYSTRKEEPHEV